MTTIRKAHMKCPCCRRRFPTRILTSTNNGGSYSTDLHVRAAGLQPLEFIIHTCTRCGYSGSGCDFDDPRPSADLEALVYENIRPLIRKERPHSARKYEYAAWIANWRGDPYWKVGELYLRAAWRCEDLGWKDQERHYRLKAIGHLEVAVLIDKLPGTDRAKYSYLIGENYRRIGDPARAAVWFERAIDVAAQDGELKWLLDLALQQKTAPKEFIRMWDSGEG